MSNYNGTKHSSILVKCRDVSKKNESQLLTTLFGHRFAESPLAKFKADNKVRISKYKSTFPKGYEANFTDELFKIARVIHGDPITSTNWGSQKEADYREVPRGVLCH